MREAAFLAIWSDVERSSPTDYRRWLTREHATERVTPEGFLWETSRTIAHRLGRIIPSLSSPPDSY